MRQALKLVKSDNRNMATNHISDKRHKRQTSLMTFATYRYISVPLTDLYIALYAGDHERGEVPAACVVNVQV